MGRVKQDLIKRFAREVLEKHPEAFTLDYDANKKALDEMATFHSKRLRNQVAGYISRTKHIEVEKSAA